MTIWTDFVKTYAKKHHITYGCAMSQYKEGLKTAYYKFKKGEKWFIDDDILGINEEIKQKKGIDKKRLEEENKRLHEENKRLEEENKMGEEDFNIPPPTPAPIKIEPVINTIGVKLNDLEKIGKEKGAVFYTPQNNIINLGYISIMTKFKGECVPSYKKGDTLIIGLKINSDEKKTYKPQYDSIGKEIAKCIKRNISVICIYLLLAFGDSTVGHANLLIYRPFERVVERFDPHGKAFANSIKQDASVNKQLKHIFANELIQYTNGIVRYYPPSEICPYNKGFQSLETSIKGLDIEGGGFCVMWSFFMLEMVLNNPTKSTKEIIEKIMEITKQDPQFLKNTIRGYVVGIEQSISKLLNIIKKGSFSYETTDGKTLNPDELVFKFYIDMMFKIDQDVRESKSFNTLPKELTNQMGDAFDKLLKLRLSKEGLNVMLNKLEEYDSKIKIKFPEETPIDGRIDYIIKKYPPKRIIDEIEEYKYHKKLDRREMKGSGMFIMN
tara:strand:+ start:182 stop:1669 length:1488 start_codon:yes stop_codon:yes gene_type:complete